MVGSGGLVVLNQRTCMVSIARFFMEFTQRESCGKCVLCREGTKQLLALLDDVIEGRADAGTLDLLEKLGRAVQVGSLCGLGKTAPNPVLVDAALLPQGVRGAHLRETMPHRTLQGAAETGDQCRTMQRLRPMHQIVPGRRHYRRKEKTSFNRSGALHQVRSLRQGLQTASRRGSLASERAYAADINN